MDLWCLSYQVSSQATKLWTWFTTYVGILACISIPRDKGLGCHTGSWANTRKKYVEEVVGTQQVSFSLNHVLLSRNSWDSRFSILAWLFAHLYRAFIVFGSWHLHFSGVLLASLIPILEAATWQVRFCYSFNEPPWLSLYIFFVGIIQNRYL